jgi:glucokinase
MILVADVGATHTRLAAAEKDGTLGHLVVEDTPKEYGAFLSRLSAYRASLKDPIEAVSVGVAGRVENGVITTAHLSWSGNRLADDLQRLFSVPVFVDNDTVMGALGEAVLGTGKGIKEVTYIAVGTGIGGRKISNGVVDRSPVEVGHDVIEIDGVKKEWEEWVSGSALETKYGTRFVDLDDPAAWDEYARYFAAGLSPVIDAWKPELVVLGGFIASDTRLSILNIEKYLKVRRESSYMPDLAYATLPFSGLSGANLLARSGL